MKAARSRIAGVIAANTLKQGSSKKLAQQVAAYLLQERRVSELESVLRDVQVAWAEAGRIEVIAATAHPLTPSVKADITAHVRSLYPSAQQIIITEQRDRAIMGGVKLSMANQQLDLSIEAKLNKFKQLTSAGKDV